MISTSYYSGHKYYIGYVKEIASSGKFAVRFDDNNEILYNKCGLRIFPEHVSSYERKYIVSFSFRKVCSYHSCTTWHPCKFILIVNSE